MAACAQCGKKNCTVIGSAHLCQSCLIGKTPITSFPCPNCGGKMHRVLPPNGGKSWHCTAQCENATDVSKAIQEISRHAGSDQKRRWIVPGSGHMKYTVVELYDGCDPSRVWQCSCPAWTRHTPRTHCKHILRVHKECGYNPAYDTMMANYAAQAKMLKLLKPTMEPKPKQKTVTVVVPTHVPKTTGRKFR